MKTQSEPVRQKYYDECGRQALAQPTKVRIKEIVKEINWEVMFNKVETLVLIA